MRKGYVILIVIIIAALLIGGVIWMRQGEEDNGTASTTTPAQGSESTGQPEESQGQEPEETGAVVTYTGSGFEPSNLTVSQGTTVAFRNESSTEVWPASAQHPTHNELPGFDALGGLGEGEEYTFTFEQTGEWSYHNHLNSSQTGSITVE